ncbi:DUF2141 domain-containing protein [Croceibacterium salegens]|uniref:DUF2141 domain-containing protein n=1 Tax=Croceibacterium salegens TaxID=1737568 RepID=UPI000AD2C6D5
MRHRPRIVAAFGLSASALILTGAGAPGTDVRVTVTDLRSTKGLIQACLTPNPKHFPDCKGDSKAFALTVPAGEVVQLDFGHVPAGRYAIALLHDENGNGRADKALMLPREGFGFSRDAPLRMGPPTFASAAFEVGGEPVVQKIRMRYLL